MQSGRPNEVQSRTNSPWRASHPRRPAASPPTDQLTRNSRTTADTDVSRSAALIRAQTRDFFRDAAANYDPQAFAEALAAVADAPEEDTDLIGDAEDTAD